MQLSAGMSLSLILWLQAAAAFADTTRKLIVTLDAPHESTPELFCIVGEQRCAERHCSSLSAFKEVMAFDDKTIRFGVPDAWSAPASKPLEAALRALSPRSASSRDDRDKGQQCGLCTPEVTLLDLMGTPDALHGYVTCARNGRATNSDRVAVAFLRFHKHNVPAPVSHLELLGDHVTVYFSKPVDVDDYEFLISIGGDYLADTVGLGTKERMVLPLHPRCTSSTIALPARAETLAAETLTATLDGEPVNECIEPGAKSISAWLPYRPSGDLKTLRLAYASRATSVAYEARWTGRAPPELMEAQHRQLEISWRKDCLVGALPAGSSAAWSASCPRATLPVAGAACELLGSSDQHCRYRCAAASGMPAFALPTPVRFDRYGQWSSGEPEAREAYSWEDTLRYSGQELTSFLAPLDRKIIVELPDPAAWRSRPGNEIDHVELRSSSGVTRRVSIRTAPPRWAIISVPNATCAERFTVNVIGARTFDRVDQGLSETGNLVLDSPRRYRDLFHWIVVLGGGALLPRNQLVYQTERDAEPYGTVGAGFELYLQGPFADAFELTLLYEPTRTAYGVVRLPSDRGDRLAKVPYHRGIVELAVTRWGRNREWQVGLMGGGGLGGPLSGDTEKVGTLRSFVFAGVLGRIKPSSLNAWIELNAGVRWREQHQFFGTDRNGDPSPETFHGEPERTERRLIQLYGGLRIRGALL
jgi:hypothetical protein